MSALSNIIAQLESGGGVYANAQPSSMVNPTYGQYAGFVNTYGSGAAGVDNYAQAYLTANPNATFGQFYASYVLGTGSPTSPGTATLTDLQTQQPAAYTNLLNNAGISPNIPLSSLTSSQATLQDTLTQDFSPQYNSSLYNPETGLPNFVIPGTDQNLQDLGGNTYTPIQTDFGSSSASPGTFTGSSTGSASNFWSTLWGDITNIMARAGLIIIGVVIIGIAAYAAVKGEGPFKEA